MLEPFLNIFKLPDLKKRLTFTLLILAVYRVGCYIPTPGIDTVALAQIFNRFSQSQGGMLFGLMNMFSGGAISRLTIFALGIMPYISSSIIMQLLTAVIPALERIAKEGPAGHRKILQFTRYGTIGLSLVQSLFIAIWLENAEALRGVVANPGWGFRFITVITLTTGTAFIMWLGEQVQERGIGNGISLIITAGIVSRVPSAFYRLYVLASPFAPSKSTIEPYVLLILVVLFIAVTLAITMIIQGQRRIPVQYARRIVGRRVYGGQSTFLPLKVDQANVIPIIFAQAIILFPATIASFIPNPAFQAFASRLIRGDIIYNIIYAALIMFFCYFYTAIVFNPVDVAENLKKYGGFVPGVRPGRPTAEFLDFIVTRITLAGAVFLTVVAILPDAVTAWLKVDPLVATFLGGTSLLITIGVMLDTVKQIEAQLLLHNYEGFLKEGRIRGRR